VALPAHPAEAAASLRSPAAFFMIAPQQTSRRQADVRRIRPLVAWLPILSSVHRRPTMRLVTSLALAVAFSVVGGGAQTLAGQSGAKSPADSAALKETTRKWREAAIRGDAEAYMRYVADDAVFLAPNLEPIVGRAAISAFVAGVFKTISVTEVLSNQAPVSSQNLGFVWGTYDATYTDKAKGTKTPELGNHLFLWQRGTTGEWKLRVAIWNTKPRPTK
jgi:uncharacterized protein (TIGR02246 family)